jgi:ParB-like chromosome segregation protein Spo0J
MKPMTIEPMAVARLRPFARNARTHSKKQIRQIADSIERFGFTNPVLVGEDDEIIAGHGRVAVAKLLGLPSVPTLRLSHLDAAQRRAYVLADNKIALNAGWDRAVLAVELQALVDLEFDLEVTGFSLGEIELVLDEPREPEHGESSDPREAAEAAVPPRAAPAAVTRGADLWLLDRHRLLCGDPRDLGTFDRLLGERASLVFIAFDEAACDRMVRRFQACTGREARLAATGQSFKAVAEERGSPAAMTTEETVR